MEHKNKYYKLQGIRDILIYNEMNVECRKVLMKTYTNLLLDFKNHLTK